MDHPDTRHCSLTSCLLIGQLSISWDCHRTTDDSVTGPLLIIQPVICYRYLQSPTVTDDSLTSSWQRSGLVTIMWFLVPTCHRLINHTNSQTDRTVIENLAGYSQIVQFWITYSHWSHVVIHYDPWLMWRGPVQLYCEHEADLMAHLHPAVPVVADTDARRHRPLAPFIEQVCHIILLVFVLCLCLNSP